jgi:hypothetical protein
MKAFWKSLTLWFNSIVASLALVLPELMLQLPAMQAYVPSDLYRWLFIFTVLGNVIIRIRTTTAVGLKDA